MRIAVLTTGRQDWGILRSTCQLLRSDARFDLRLLIGGMHASERFGLTGKAIEDEGFKPAEWLAWVGEASEAAAHRQAGRALREVGDALERQRPRALLLVGDRFETAAAAVAATVARVPLVHLHGGEETEGAFDNVLRHAISKLAHLHFVSHEDHATRLRAMGEDPATIHVVGAPGLDNAHRADLPSRPEIEARLGLALRPPVVIVSLHPTTLGGDGAREVAALTAAMGRVDATYVVTLPNSDPGHEAIREALLAASDRPRRRTVEALGDRFFWGLLREADAMLGNSSSALIEAPVLQVPAVNVGDRQKGRLRGENVIDVPAETEAIAAGLRNALSNRFRAALTHTAGPFGDGRSGPRIIEILRAWRPPQPPVKPTWARGA